MEDDQLAGELLTWTPRRVGVVVGVAGQVSTDMAAEIVARLTDRFPGVTFAVVPGAASVAFNFD